MSFGRWLASVLAISRVAFGLRFLLQPSAAGPSWIGTAARLPQTQLIVRGLGARDLALALGTIGALVQRDDPALRAWMTGHLISDGADLAATVSARERLPRESFIFAASVAAASTAAAAGSVAALSKVSGTEHHRVDQ
jgi:hypothetical protein